MADTTARRLGLSFPVLVILALLAVPRVVAHDLNLVGAGVNAVLVWVPLIIWVVVVVGARVPNPFLTLLVVGLVYGLALAVAHQLMWDAAFGGDAPRLGGNLEGALPVAAEGTLLRVFAAVSSLITGTVVGAATGVVAWVLAKLTGRISPS